MRIVPEQTAGIEVWLDKIGEGVTDTETVCAFVQPFAVRLMAYTAELLSVLEEFSVS